MAILKLFIDDLFIDGPLYISVEQVMALAFQACPGKVESSHRQDSGTYGLG